MPMARKMKLGNHTAMNGDMAPVTEKVLLTVENNTYAAERAMPMPRFFPMPPLTLRELRLSASSVMMKAPIGEAKRRWSSVSNAFVLPAPRSVCLRIYCLSS